MTRPMILSLSAVVAAVPFVMFVRPGATPQDAFRGELVGAGVIATEEAGQVFPAVAPDGSALYFSQVKDRNWGDQTIMVAQRRGDGWAPPRVASFSGSAASDRAPRFSVDGNLLFFSSNRPLPGTQTQDFNLWVVERTAGGNWSAPRALSINTEAVEMHSAVTRDGTLYFASSGRPDGLGRSDLYRAQFRDGRFGPPEPLGEPVNSPLSQPDVYVSPDGDWMILAITDHPDGMGGDDLYVSYWRAGAWTAPRNLGPAVNTPEYEYGPTVSGDGEYLYFTSHRRAAGDIYRIRLREVLD